MAAEKREQVFVSSTFKDLVDERAAVTQTLLEADCIPAGMEMFPASDSDKFDLIKRVIDLCDYYVVIIAGRYGSVDVEEQLSYTEMEYDYAVQAKKPVMAFLHGDPGKLIGEKLDLDASLREKLDAFREKAEKRIVKYWHEPGDLKGQVALAMIQIRKSHPAEGWIRAGEAMTPEVKTELAELRVKVRELTADLEDEQRRVSAAVDRSELSQGEEKAHITAELDFHWQSAFDDSTAYPHNRSRGLWTVQPTWNRVFRHLGPELMDEASEEHLMERLSALCLELSDDDRNKSLKTTSKCAVSDDDSVDGKTPEGKETDTQDSTNDASDGNNGEDDDGGLADVGRIYEATVTVDSFNDVKVQLAALGMIEKGSKRRPSSDANTYWRLTELGGIELVRLRAIRKPAPGRSEYLPDATR